MFAFVISSAILVPMVPALLSLQDCQHPFFTISLFLKSLFSPYIVLQLLMLCIRFTEYHFCQAHQNWPGGGTYYESQHLRWSTKSDAYNFVNYTDRLLTFSWGVMTKLWKCQAHKLVVYSNLLQFNKKCPCVCTVWSTTVQIFSGVMTWFEFVVLPGAGAWGSPGASCRAAGEGAAPGFCCCCWWGCW